MKQVSSETLQVTNRVTRGPHRGFREITKQLAVLLAIVLFAGFLRFYKLGINPPSLDWDETSLAYNAWALSETGHDEYGNSWPLSIQSFGDYKPPLYIYLLIPSLRMFGRTEFAVRLPSAVAGTLIVLVTFYLAKEMIGESNLLIPLLASFLIAISPWHLQFSRIAFEANLGLLFYVLATWLLLRWINRQSSWSLFFSSVAGSAALMSYHSIRIVLPLLVLVILIVYKNKFSQHLRSHAGNILIALVPGMVTIVIVLYTMLIQGVGQSRFVETSFLTIDNLLTESRGRVERFPGDIVDHVANHRYLVYIKQYFEGYLDHFNIRFWFLDGDRIDRHRAPSVGLLYWFEFPLLMLGGLIVIKRITNGEQGAAVLALYALLAPAASALTGGTPSAVRSLLFLPSFQIFEAVGLYGALKVIGKLNRLKRIFFSLFFILIFSFEFSHYLHQYYTHAPIEYAHAWQYGYKQMVERVMQEKDRYGKILITTSYDQPYIYFLWYGNYSPTIWKNDGEFNKRFDRFVFQKVDELTLQSESQKSLVIGDGKELGGAPSLWTVSFPDHSSAFVATEVR